MLLYHFVASLLVYQFTLIERIESETVLCIGEEDSSMAAIYNCSMLVEDVISAFDEVKDNCIIQFINDNEYVEYMLKLESVSNVAIFGSNQGTEIRCIQQAFGYGLQFTNISNFKLSGIIIKHCGALYQYKSSIAHQGLTGYNFSTAIHFENCTNIEINYTTVIDSIGTGLSMYDCNGVINVHNSNFLNNSVHYIGQDSFPTLLLGGGGLYFELTYCSPSLVTCDPSTNQYNEDVRLHIHNCTFANNAVTKGSSNLEFTKYIGGGLMIYLSGQAYNNTLTIQDSVFNNNRGLYGGGLTVLCKDSPSYNNITVKNVLAINNIAELGGGGFDLGFYSSAPFLNQFNHITVISCTIERNRAYFGGGIVFFSTLATQSDPSNLIEFHDTVFSMNKASYGSGIYLEPIFNDLPTNSFFPVPLFVNCNFTKNYITFNNTGNSSGAGISSVGAGALNTKAISMKFKGTIIFDGNNGTALYLIDSNLIVLEGTSLLFTNNTGTYGGAVSINGFASIFVYTNTSLRFLHNVATIKGGAIYFYSFDIHSSILTGSSCFLEKVRTILGKTITNLYFQNNTDSFGKTMYVSSLLPCNKLCQGTNVYLTYISPDRLLSDECIGNFIFYDHNGTVSGNVATEASEFDRIGPSSNRPLSVVPGKDFLIPFETKDELGHISVEPLFAVLSTDSSMSLQNVYTANNKFQVMGSPNDTGHLQIGTLYFRNLTTGIEVQLSECPPGFINSNNTCKCSADYDDEQYNGITRCDNKEFQASISAGFWAGYIGSEYTESHLFTGVCPYGYCNNSELLSIKLPSVPGKLDSLICGGRNRTGILCGECIENNSVYFNSPGYKCGNNDLCTYGPIFYLLSSILPLTLMFTAILLFGIDFNSGIWNGFVFYAQIVGYLTTTGNGIIYFSPAETVFHVISVLLYGLFSLQFFYDDSLSFCLFKNANFFAILGMECLSLFFAFVLTIVLLFIMKSNYFYKLQGICCKRPIFKPTTLTKALSTFLLLCYTQTTQICFKILHFGFLRGKGNAIITPARVFKMGSQEYFTGLHIPFALGALLGIITIVSITPLFLMFYPVYYKAIPESIQNRKWFESFNTKVEIFKPVFDSFQGCFKDRYRFFAGLYFLYRAILVGIFALVSIQLASLSIAQVVIMIMLALHLWIQPYKKSLHNGIDGSLFLLLGIINTLTLTRYFESISQSQIETLIFTGYLQLFFVFLPVVVVLFCLIVLFIKLCRKKLGCQVKCCKKKEKTLIEENFDTSTDTITTSFLLINDTRYEIQDDSIRKEFLVLENV